MLFNGGGSGLIPGWGTKIPHASDPRNQNIKQEQYYNMFCKDFKNSPHQKKALKKKQKKIKHTAWGQGCGGCSHFLFCLFIYLILIGKHESLGKGMVSR